MLQIITIASHKNNTNKKCLLSYQVRPSVGYFEVPLKSCEVWYHFHLIINIISKHPPVKP